MIESEKMDSYDEEDVHTYDKRNQLKEEKKRSCRVIAELEKL